MDAGSNEECATDGDHAIGPRFPDFLEKRARYPRFRRKGINERFTLTNDKFQVDSKRIRIPKIGWLKMRERLRYTGRIVSATVSRTADHWYVSISIDTSDAQLPPAENQGAVGIDFGVTHLATLSTGEKVTGPKALRTLLDRLRSLSRALSRKIKGSCNRRKARAKLARLHARIANVRSNGLHQLSASITRRFHTIGIEDLHVKGMLGNRCLSRGIADMGFAELRRQLDYKAKRRGGQVIVIDRWYPSSKTCSCCGYNLEVLSLDVRHWTCPECAMHHDRDVNAAINLRIARAGTAC